MIDLGTCTLRHATPLDRERINNFFAEHAHANNVARGDDALLRAITVNRKLFLLVHEDKIVGVSGVARAVHEYLMDPDYEEYFSTVLAAAEASIRNIEAAGFERWDDPDSALVKAKKKLRPTGSHVKGLYYRLPREALGQHAILLLDLGDGKALGRTSRQNPDEQEQVTLVPDIECLRWYRPVVEQLTQAVNIHE